MNTGRFVDTWLTYEPVRRRLGANLFLPPSIVGLLLQILGTGGLYLLMRMTISGLPRDFDKFDLQRLFNPYGWVDYAKIIIDPLSGQSRGRGIVEMKQDDQAKQAMAALQGKVLATNPLNIKEAKEGGFKPW